MRELIWKPGFGNSGKGHGIGNAAGNLDTETIRDNFTRIIWYTLFYLFYTFSAYGKNRVPLLHETVSKASAIMAAKSRTGEPFHGLRPRHKHDIC
jgi:hypothetical protein